MTNRSRQCGGILADRVAKCGPFGAHRHDPHRDLFIFDRLREGWTRPECAWSLGITTQAVDNRIARFRRASPAAAYREINDGTDVWWRCVDGRFQYRVMQHGIWRELSDDDAAAIVHPGRVAVMAVVRSQPFLDEDSEVAA
jgi:hypothetical protein